MPRLRSMPLRFLLSLEPFKAYPTLNCKRADVCVQLLTIKQSRKLHHVTEGFTILGTKDSNFGFNTILVQIKDFF
jgi:hypothetical protein